MNREHLELCASDAWSDMLHDLVLPYTLADTALGDDALEIGPGPGRTTELLRARVTRLTALELDEQLAAELEERMADTNVEVVQADATAMPFEDHRFSGAISLTMLHHVPTIEGQDRVFAEVARVLRPGGVFVASDSVGSDNLAALHHDDIYNPVDPATLEHRLTSAGFTSTEVRSTDTRWAVRATVPAAAQL